VQSFNEEVCRLISRRQDARKLEENFRFLREKTGVYIHADLIAGCLGNFGEFGAGFDRLIGLRPHEIQVGILKRLRGTPIVRHDQEWAMSYNSHPPYEILQNKLLDFVTLQRCAGFRAIGSGREQREFCGEHAAALARRRFAVSFVPPV